jgi:release factor glutamine methyltransferase
MLLNVALPTAQKQLSEAGIETARLDSLILLEDTTGRDRAWLLAHPEFELSDDQTGELEKLLDRRAQHEPLAYIRGKTEFYGREYFVAPAVLVPRPESEAMIDLLKNLPELPARLRLADIGTGSGALGITAKLELPKASVDLFEISMDALTIAQMNVDKFTLDIDCVQSDLLASVPRAYDVILANLPYVPDTFPINQAAQHEPALALYGGADGLDLYRKLFLQIEQLATMPLYILLEALPEQHATLQEYTADQGFTLFQTHDFIQAYKSNKL